jgi:ABC-type phosphate transport system substrate-binding protein
MRFVSARRVMSACIVSAAGVAAMALPGVASAAGPVRCSGASAIGGQGSSLQKVAQEKLWIPSFTETSTNTLACAGKAKQGDEKKLTVTYNPSGSGAGLRSWGAETKLESEIKFGVTNAFVGTDEPPNEGQAGEIEKQESTDTPGTLETIPVAQEAVAIIVNLPEVEGTHCTATSTGATGRLVITDEQLAKIYEGGITTWGGISGDGDELKPAACDSASITPVVRFDQSGTTHIFKRYLNLINPASFETEKGTNETWGQLSEGAGNTVWPKNAHVIRPLVKGGGELIKTVDETPGRIGYVNVAEAREHAAYVPPTGGKGTSTFWLKLENSSKGTGSKVKLTYEDPASNEEEGTPAESNCAKTAYTNGENPFPPPAVTEFWNNVTTSVPGPDSVAEKGYSLCGLTYDLAFTKYSLLEAKGATSGEAVSVENYLTFVTSKKAGDLELKKDDYSPLPKAVLTIAEKGAAKVAF